MLLSLAPSSTEAVGSHLQAPAPVVEPLEDPPETPSGGGRAYCSPPPPQSPLYSTGDPRRAPSTNPVPTLDRWSSGGSSEPSSMPPEILATPIQDGDGWGALIGWSDFPVGGEFDLVHQHDPSVRLLATPAPHSTPQVHRLARQGRRRTFRLSVIAPLATSMGYSISDDG